jgi:hypothetical protein
MRGAAIAIALASFALAPAAVAKKQPRAAWQVMRVTDPITRASSCAVTASDYVGKIRFTQMGGLYPVVEMNSTYGLLVGVSSGGRYRLPTGDVLWVVDEHPHRELHAADNPGTPTLPVVGGDPTQTTNAATAYAMQMVKTGVSTSTMASGAKAREMLDEMLGGKSLLFRSAGFGPQIGLPNYSALMAGQFNEKGQLRPVPLDDSFREGLKACGIVPAS